MAKIKRALISVSDKTGIANLAKGLKNHSIEILSTGGTAKLLRESGVDVIEVSDYTGFPEIMGGRVKTLHPKIHGGLLAVRDNEDHMNQIENLGIGTIDLVVVNLYPFEKTVSADNVTQEQAIENIDIGGPSMIRSAAKNFKHVAVVVNPGRYESLLRELNDNDGDLTLETRQQLVLEAFKQTSHYDRVIAKFFEKVHETEYPEILSLEFYKKQELRYGENPHQSSAFYVHKDFEESSVSNAEQLNGKDLSYNNIIDVDVAIEIVKEFEEPSAVLIKHTNPCGVASAETLNEAFSKAYQSDPISAFGCIVGINRVIDEKTAEAITESGHFVEAIAAPGFEDKAFEILTKKRKWGQDLRLLKLVSFRSQTAKTGSKVLRGVTGGMLVQGKDDLSGQRDKLKVVTKKSPSEGEIEEMLFAWKVCKHVKSNAIVLSHNKMVVGVGAGQMSRVDSTNIAIQKAGTLPSGTVLASDAFFPFRDSVDIAAKNGVFAIIQPGGSKKDDEVIKAADENGIAMIFAGERHFKH
ncbi:MAG: bifunctional phosphoribosylaminoimidazolecarboxamide formyltransferase/IMP cyclohydrolase PurH [Candidatus Scalindua sp. AMX11]|nr:MAG: bifunctional phosphoribosylaminoimidazolecarboxamide formyltransferase/IMP cyclohydrolase PurH [Candidatus Scalindua sp.]NOG85955.1 bifunctional phosphoribosylaminoimidazolecarboxamide formyltransferase/IMP cyclohydrolase [Planctomycetota bacterium]RZV91413.1 MAG: bifunctional phosphoribosylaminoimidazolecarboxamide formyltransferase/IMP cyclohydrolase [Candidatus Scalindua sp. SCAELEC01]TDE65971.1 MAG: bifunctional phosphoribosylaminoimidazolecarboxamide formyltransferase/IMP cyclohydro